MSYLDRDKFGIYRDRDDNDGPGPRLMGADTLLGEDVYNRQDEDLGDIKEIMLDMQSGRIAYAVLSFGGMLGMGDKLFAVPWQALELDTTNKRFILDVSKDRLENAPGFDKDRWPDMASSEFTTQVHTFYGTHPDAGYRTSTGSVMGQGTNTMQSGQQSATYSTGQGNISRGTGSSSQSAWAPGDEGQDLHLRDQDTGKY